MAVKVHETGYGKWKIPVILVAVIVVLALAGTGILLSDSTGIDIDTDSVSLEITEGSGPSSVARMLKDKGVIKYPLLFKIQSKLGGYDGGFQPGALTVSDGMSYSQILDLIITPNRGSVKVVIPEGYEVKQIAQKLDEAGLVGWQDFYAALNPQDYDYRFLKDLPQRDGVMEGYLFPATYEIPYGMSAHDIIDLMLSAFNNQFKDEYYSKAQEMGMSVDEIVTMASIIEREAGDGEKPKVSGVFYNRLKSNMKLQSCATVQYILGERKPVLSISDTQIDSPYNTYKYSGFPAGPICNPGIESIEAALYPELTDAYYFVLGKNGEHIFSKTYEEHLAAMDSSDPAMSVADTAIENQDNLKQ